MAHRWIDHTSELELHVEAESEADVVAEATRALAELLGDEDEEDGDPGDAAGRRPLEVRARDRAALLAAWLEEVVFLAEGEGLVARDASGIALGDGVLAGTLHVSPGRPRHLVKAITYHRLAFEPAGSGWRATVVLDV